MFALLLQIALLGALGSSRLQTTEVILEPVSNSERITGDTIGNQSIRFATDSGPAVAQQIGLQTRAAGVLAINITHQPIQTSMRATLGWLSTANLRRPGTANFSLPPAMEPITRTVLFAGNPLWRDSITRLGLAFDRSNQGIAVDQVQLIAANPAGAVQLLTQVWFKPAENLLKPNGTPTRILPLSLWFAVICALSLLLAAAFTHAKPIQRAQLLRKLVVVLALLGLLLTFTSNTWLGWDASLLAGLSALLALLVLATKNFNSHHPLVSLLQSLNIPQQLLLAAMFIAIAFVITPVIGWLTIVPALILAANLIKPAPWSLLGTLLLAIPVLLVCAWAQGLLTPPEWLGPILDPTATLARLGIVSVAIPAWVLALLLLFYFWPADPNQPRWSRTAAAATLWAAGGLLFLMSLPNLTKWVGDLGTSKNFVALVLPFLSALTITLLPKFGSVAALETVNVVTPLTEADLSPQARQLLEGQAIRLQDSLSNNNSGSAHMALNEMQRMAPEALATQRAGLTLALRENNQQDTARYAAKLKQHTELNADDYAALTLAAHLIGEPATSILGYAQQAMPSPVVQRVTAIAHLMNGSRDNAIATLATSPDVAIFSLELAELYLLENQISEAQQHLARSGLALETPTGQAYVARLGMRATGADEYFQQAQNLSTWHPQLGTAQAAAGDALFLIGNAQGARARWLLALNLDPALWPLKSRIKTIDTQ